MTGNTIPEALEPLIRLHDEVFRDGRREDYEDDRAVWGFNSVEITYGDLRRARTAYDAIGSGVKADIGWIEWTGGETPVEPGTEGLLRVEDGEVIYTKQLGSFNFAHDRSGPFPGRRIIAYRVLSTHTDAGAGPVGEAVAWQCRSRPWAGSGDGTAKWSDWMPGHSGNYAKTEPRDWENRPLYATPVEEPGEVERLTRENNRLTDAAMTAEAALAETRERLEKLEAENAARLERAIRDAAIAWCGEKERETFSPDIAYFENNWRSLPGLRQRVELHLGRAALTGDAQEASPMEKLGKFGWHPDPVIDFEVEIEKLESRLDCAMRGTSKPGERAETVQAVHDDIRRAMTFKAGGTVEGVVAKNRLRDLEAKAIAASAGDA